MPVATRQRPTRGRVSDEKASRPAMSATKMATPPKSTVGSRCVRSGRGISSQPRARPIRVVAHVSAAETTKVATAAGR